MRSDSGRFFGCLALTLVLGALIWRSEYAAAAVLPLPDECGSATEVDGALQGALLRLAHDFVVPLDILGFEGVVSWEPGFWTTPREPEALRVAIRTLTIEAVSAIHNSLVHVQALFECKYLEAGRLSREAELVLIRGRVIADFADQLLANRNKFIGSLTKQGSEFALTYAARHSGLLGEDGLEWNFLRQIFEEFSRNKDCTSIGCLGPEYLEQLSAAEVLAILRVGMQVRGAVAVLECAPNAITDDAAWREMIKDLAKAPVLFGRLAAVEIEHVLFEGHVDGGIGVDYLYDAAVAAESAGRLIKRLSALPAE